MLISRRGHILQMNFLAPWLGKGPSNVPQMSFSEASSPWNVSRDVGCLLISRGNERDTPGRAPCPSR